jgi:tellurite resistance protein TerC
LPGAVGPIRAEETSGLPRRHTRKLGGHLVTVPAWVWLATIGVMLAVLLVDLLIVGRRPHEPSLRESTAWVLLYVALAAAFGFGVFAATGGRFAGEFFAGWLTEYSLSVDNLFVFVVIMARFSVPREYQQKVLLVGIVLALVMRGIFIAVGAAAISAFSWIFYIFGAFLLFTAVQLIRQGPTGKVDYEDNLVLRLVRRTLPATGSYAGARLTTVVNGRRLVTPMLVVMIAIGTTDLLFALDSIPAIFGLTKEPYLVFTANVFALMGLRQLYFLIGGLLDRLVYLNRGLAVVLGFIGVKLLIEALHGSGVHALGPVTLPTIGIAVSLGFIAVTLLVTTVASVLRTRWQARRAPGGPASGAPPRSRPAPGPRPGGEPQNGPSIATRQTISPR